MYHVDTVFISCCAMLVTLVTFLINIYHQLMPCVYDTQSSHWTHGRHTKTFFKKKIHSFQKRYFNNSNWKISFLNWAFLDKFGSPPHSPLVWKMVLYSFLSGLRGMYYFLNNYYGCFIIFCIKENTGNVRYTSSSKVISLLQATHMLNHCCT